MEPQEQFALSTSRHFPAWLAATGGSLAFTTYQGNKLFMVGVKEDGKLSIFERTYPRCMGLGVSADGRSLALATQWQMFRLDNLLEPGQAEREGYDALFAPHGAWITGDIDAHDAGFGPDGRPVFVNTLFSCLAAVSDSHSFRPFWQPPFVSRLAAEDRCHLNGMAMQGGAVTHVTAVSTSDVADGWRDRRRDGGVLIDVAANEIAVSGLSMPHSPRWRNGRLWLLNSGRGEFGYADLAAGRFEAAAFCPGYARGLAFAGGHAVVGLSMARENRTFSGLELDAALAARNAEARCGLAVIDLATGDMVHWVRIEGVIREFYDVAFLPGIRRPALVGLKGDAILRTISIEG